MLKTFLAVLLSLSFSFSTHASTGLQAAYNEFHYAFTVEWDQKDEAFFNKQQAILKSKLQTLKANGLTNAEIISFLESQIPDQKIAHEIGELMSVVMMSKMSPEEASEFIVNELSKSHQTGASWNAIGYVLGGVGVVVVLYFSLVLLDSLDITG